eukprot:TRINITY_DN39907_c0_g1_i1.p1 TRINITY_DN39907_c0_g1~~TRINITY_DN39907_c0_g1_i1.p1  ORF type:complete len:160 (-),score=19.83 TRINITY_DN39907_c0_g1_i1:259-738(-)
MVAKRHRYFLFEVILGSGTRSGRLEEDEVSYLVRESLAANWGDVGEALAQLKLLYWSPAVNFGVLRCARASMEHVQSSLFLLTHSRGGQPLQLSVHRIGGTLRSIQTCGAELLRSMRHTAAARATSPEEADAVRKGFDTEVGLLAEIGRNWQAGLGGDV